MRHSRSRVTTTAGLALALALSTATMAQADHRLQGESRFETAAKISDASFPGATSFVIAKSGQGDPSGFADALSGAYLASFVDGPILLTATTSFSAATQTEMERQIAEAEANGDTAAASDVEIFILGGLTAVDAATEAEIRAAFPDATVTRLSGDDRYATGEAVIEYVRSESTSDGGGSFVGTLGTSGPTALIVRGDDFPDALAAGPLAFESSFPIILTRPGALPQASLDALADNDVEYAVVIGGETAVSEDVRQQLTDVGISSQRVSGDSRTETAAEVATFAKSQLGFSSTNVTLARGDDFADALTGGTYGGVFESPILLTANPSTLSSATRQWLEDNASTVQTVTALGGESAVNETTIDEANTAAGN